MSAATLGRVLIVDDELQLMNALVEALNAQGYSTIGFQAGEPALKALQTEEFDLLLTDLMMPGMGGVDLLKAGLAMDQNLVCIIMTGQGTVPTAVETMKVGAFDYILKPFKMREILPILARGMEVRQLRLENIQLRDTAAIYRLSQTVASSLDSKLILEMTADAALQQFEADEVSIMLLTPPEQELYIAVARGANRQRLMGRRISLEDGIAGWVARHYDPLLLNGKVSDPRFKSIQPRREIRSAISMPMQAGGKIVGVLNVNRLKPRHAFTAGQVKALSILASTAAAALENEALYRAVESREKHFRALIENSSDAVALLSTDGIIRYVSDSIVRMLGYMPEQIVGQNTFDLIHVEDHEPLQAAFMEVLQEARNVVAKIFRFRHKDGSWRLMEGTAQNLLDEPSVGAIVVNYRDITERAQAEQALRDREALLSKTQLISHVGSWELDLAANRLAWSDEVFRIFGLGVQEFAATYEAFLEAIHPEDRAAVDRAYSESVRTGADGYDIGHRIIRRDTGEVRFVYEKCEHERDASGQIVRSVGMVQDITERKLAEDALIASHKRFQALVEHAPDGIALLGLDGKLRQVTPSTYQILGYTLEEAVSQDPSSLTHPEDLPALLGLLNDLIQNPSRVVSAEYRFRHQDGSWRWLESTISNLLAEPSVEALVFNYRDITDRKQAEQEIESLANLAGENTGPVLRFARDGRLLYANPASAGLLRLWGCEVGGWAPDEIQLLIYQSLVMPMSQEIEVAREHRIEALMLVPIVDKDYVNVYGRDITERKQAEAALTNSEKRFRVLIENNNDVIAVFDHQSTFLYTSASLTRIFGYVPEEVIGTPLGDYVHPDERAGFEATWSRLLQAPRHVIKMEFSGRHKDGSWRWLDATAQNLLNDSSVKGVVVNFRDVTERRQAEEALHESELQYRNLVETSKDLIWSVDGEGKITYLNRASKNVYGFEPDELIGHPFFELVDPGSTPRNLDEFKTLIANVDKFVDAEAIVQHRDGRRIILSANSIVLRDSENQVVGIVGTSRDVTERKQAQEKIERQLQHLNSLRTIDVAISSSFDIRVTLDIVLQQVLSEPGVAAAAILLYDPERQTLQYAASRGFRSDALRGAQLKLGDGYASRAVLERETIRIPGLLDPGTALAEVMQSAKEEFLDYYGMPLIVKDQVKGVLEVYHRSLPNPDPESLEFLETLAGQAAIALDNAQLFENLQRANAELERRVAERTAELNQTNAELGRANRSKDEFLANMSHELRTPLNVILGLSEVLLEYRRGPLTEPQEKALHMISSSGQHLLGLINDVLDVSKIEAGKLQIHPDVISVKEVCESSLNFVKELALKKSISLDYQNRAEIKSVYADPQRLKQILVNLLNNAVKFTPEKGSVSLGVELNEERDQIRFIVTDTGIGISPEDLQKLFKPFTQLDSSLSRQYEGTGLGLVLVYKFTELHGGSVQVESKVGTGSRLTIALPWNETPSTRPDPDEAVSVPVKMEPEQSTSPAGSSGLVLLVEDNESNILFVSDYLQEHGFQVALANNGFEALDQAEKLSPSLILMDIQMPEMNGVEAICRLRAIPRFATTPIIALTALAMPGDRERCLEAGANEYVSKPASLKTLVKTIRRLLNQGE